MLEQAWASYLYYGVVLVLGPIAIWAVERTVRKTERKRKKKYKEQSILQPVETNSPMDAPVQTTRKETIDNIGKRFSIIERMSILAIIGVWLFLLFLPRMGGISSSVFSILVGSSAVVIGIAARPFIENLISGIIISFSKPFRTGDTVLVDDKYGVVEDITLTFTIVKIWNWRRYIIPNSQMLAKTFVNYSLKDTYQWMHIEFWVSYQADLKLVEMLALEAARTSPHFVSHEEPSFWVMNMDKDGYKCWLAAWSDSPGAAWELGTEMRARLITSFRKHGIHTHTLHYQHASTPATGMATTLVDQTPPPKAPPFQE